MSEPVSCFTIGAVRRRLADLGIPVTRAEIEAIRRLVSADRLRLALDKADTEVEARSFICEVVAQVRKAPIGSLFSPAAVDAVVKTTPSTDAPARPLKACRFPPSAVLPDPAKFPRPAPERWQGRTRASVERIAPGSSHESLHLYGSSAALTVSAGRNRNGEAVVFIDAAAATAPRSYAWPDKLTLMLTPDEMLTALAVATGAVSHAGFSHHGEARDKWLEIEHQGANLFVKVGQAKAIRAVPLSPADAFKLVALLTAQIKANVPEGARAEVAWLLRTTVVPMLTAAAPRVAPHPDPPCRSANPASRFAARPVAIPATGQ